MIIHGFEGSQIHTTNLETPGNVLPVSETNAVALPALAATWSPPSPITTPSLTPPPETYKVPGPIPIKEAQFEVLLENLLFTDASVESFYSFVPYCLNPQHQNTRFVLNSLQELFIFYPHLVKPEHTMVLLQLIHQNIPQLLPSSLTEAGGERARYRMSMIIEKLNTSMVPPEILFDLIFAFNAELQESGQLTLLNLIPFLCPQRLEFAVHILDQEVLLEYLELISQRLLQSSEPCPFYFELIRHMPNWPLAPSVEKVLLTAGTPDAFPFLYRLANEGNLSWAKIGGPIALGNLFFNMTQQNCYDVKLREEFQNFIQAQLEPKTYQIFLQQLRFQANQPFELFEFDDNHPRS